jgi:DNA-directed RNA polymerase specialized sigma24 family protein
MQGLVPDQEFTRDDDLANWNAFCLAYYQPILRALRFLRVPEGQADDLAHSFLVKAAERNFLDTFRAFQARESQAGRPARFRRYLYCSLQNHVRDAYRARASRVREQPLVPRLADTLEADSGLSLDPDALFALDVLHQAVQALRRHCERTGKPHLWVIFEEFLLASEFRGRRCKTRAELLEEFGQDDPQFLDNALTTAKRAFRRFVQDVIPRGLRDQVTPAERFDEWMAILRKSNASQFNLLHLAYRVTPFLSPDMNQIPSVALLVDERVEPDGGGAACEYEEPSLVPGDDELSILLSFRLELPLGEMLDATDLQNHIPPTSPLWPLPRAGTGAHARRDRPACLLTLIDPSPAEAEALEGIDLLGLLERLKSLAKQLRWRPDHSVPEVFTRLLYTTVTVLALVRCGAEIHSVGAGPLAGNVRWFLRQPWLDDRLRPLFESGLRILEAPPAPDT